ncbi:MAG: FHA domain-containing protein [Myxococcales bacterium]|nr:FHA domain-containing protein [Myxococcales bacterium]
MTFDSPRILVGRGEGCEVRLPDPSVSHRHLTIRSRGAEQVLVDEGSTNGTRLCRIVDGKRTVTLLTPQAPQRIQSGDLVRVGRLWIELELGAEMPTRKAQEVAKDIALELVIEALAADGEDGRPLLTVESGPDAGAEKRVEGLGELVVGRSKEADFMLSDADLSRRHLQLRRRGDLLVVQDLGSKAGCSIDDQPLGSAAQVWRQNAALTMGATTLRYTFEAASALAEIERMPDAKVPPSELWPEATADADEEETADGFDDEVVEGTAEALASEADDGSRASVDEAMERDTRERTRGRWSITDFAVMLLAIGVFSLSTVGYFVLLR